MGELSIKIKIANRVYPLTVNTNEEEGIRKAADNINHSIAEFERLYDVKDKQDLLAMVALKLATRNFDLENKGVVNSSGVEEELMAVEKLFDKYL